MQEETPRLFREEGVSPAAGCLPILIEVLDRAKRQLALENFCAVTEGVLELF
ncbi:MAG: YidC/Oxa1 family membrane protein insertase [Puniceicoccales bacterium]|nr:YidC/Oxa1 family membrane protein insertase [Puniceicoccales bacterium]